MPQEIEEFNKSVEQEKLREVCDILAYEIPNCGRELGAAMDYKKENRPAYRLYAGAVKKRIVSAREL
ncbi:hypothetical protein IT415_02815 [bacterium]|nr:hypothetical protein [bacterium]